MNFNSRQDSSNVLHAALSRFHVDPELLTVLSAIGTSVVEIGTSLRRGSRGFEAVKLGSHNSFGDEQLAVDVSADDVVFENLRRCRKVATAASEETCDKEQILLTSERRNGKVYSVAFDPLDGSSIVDANFAVGSIFGVWEGPGLLGRIGREQKAAVMAMYGPRISMMVALAEPEMRCVELTYSSRAGGWICSRDDVRIAAKGKVFAPGNLRASCDNRDYRRLIDHWLENGFKLRYSGGMVPDVYHILVKGKGTFTNISSPKARAKLRLLYECAPIAFIVEAAEGRSCLDPAMCPDHSPLSVLDLEVSDLDQRVGVCYGGRDNVDEYKSTMWAAGVPEWVYASGEAIESGSKSTPMRSML